MRRTVPQVETLSSDTRKLFDILNQESDLACVIVGAAFLDGALASLLGHKLIVSSVSDKLLSPSGVLGGYAARADLAYCLACVKKQHYKDICVVGEIRNQFAHSHLQLSFKESKIRQLCDQLNEWRVVLHGDDEEQDHQLNEEQLGNRARNQFNLSVAFLANWLLLNTLNLKARPKA